MHNDAVVVTLNVQNYVHHILIDNGRSTDVLYLDALIKIEIFLDQLILVDSPLIGFTGDAISIKGMISLTVTIGNYLLRSIFQVNFLVI